MTALRRLRLWLGNSRWMEAAVQDMRYALRGMRTAPGFTLAVVLTLALGIGVNTAVFSLLDALMLRPLPVRDPGSLVEMVYQYPGDPILDLFGWQDYERIRSSSHVFSAVIGTGGRPFPVRFGAEDPVPIQIEIVVGTYFSELGVRPTIGRAIDASDDKVATADVAVISWSLWKGRFNGDPAVLGRRVFVSGAPVTIVGVAPRAFTGVQPGIRTDIWLPVAIVPHIAPKVPFPNSVGLALMARLAPGVSLDQARAEMRVLDRPFIERYAARDPLWRTVAVDVRPAGTGLSSVRDQFGAPVLVLMGIVSLLLLIACSNLACLQLSRGTARRREMAVRAALGAGRSRLLRQTFTESALLSLPGTIIAISLAWFGAGELLRALGSVQKMPGWPALSQIDVHPDARVLLYTATIALFTTVLFGAAAAWPAFTVGPIAALRDRGAAAGSRLRLGNGLVAAQVALCIALLSTAGIFVRHLSNLRNVGLGFDRDSVLLMPLQPRDGTNRAQLTAEYRALLDRLRTMPGVRSASLCALTPMQPGAASHFVHIEGADERPQDRRYMMENWISPGYLATFRTLLVAGRDFVPQDDSGQPVAIVNEALSRHYFPGAPTTTPLGKHLALDGGRRTYEIVGVVADAKYNDLHEPAPPTVYFDALQEHVGSSIAIRTAVPPSAVVAYARRAAEDIVKNARVGTITTLAEQVDETITPERVTALLGIVFAALGALLAAVGVYGLLAFNIARRTSEIGIRMAIGATSGDILQMVLGNALGLASAGVIAGVPLAIWIERIAGSLVPHLASSWFLTTGLAACALACVALIAGIVPALRASRVQPMEALRAE